MPFPLIAVLATAGVGTLGYLLFKPEAAAEAKNPTLGENTGPNKKPNLPPAKRPRDLPRPSPNNQIPIPIPNLPNVRPIPIPPSPFPNNLPPSPFPIPPMPVPPSIEPTAQTGTVTAPSGVNLRSGPTTSAGVLTGLTRGTRVKILSAPVSPSAAAPKGWYKVLAPNGMTGYATAEFILPDGTLPAPSPIPNILPPSPIPIPPIPSGLTGTVLGTPGANLRSAPSTSGAILKGLFNGSKVSIINPIPTPATAGAPKGWYNVRAPSGETGYMSVEFVRIDGSPFGDDDADGFSKRSFAITG